MVSEAAEMEPDMSNLAFNLVGTARRIPDRKAEISDDATMTYAELDAAASRLAMNPLMQAREVIPPLEEA
jgi:non-ribosomal peptide synthetase component E (peptide arylation enzyme)